MESKTFDKISSAINYASEVLTSEFGKDSIIVEEFDNYISQAMTDTLHEYEGSEFLCEFYIIVATGGVIYADTYNEATAKAKRCFSAKYIMKVWRERDNEVNVDRVDLWKK